MNCAGSTKGLGEAVPGDPCPHCGSTPKLLPLPFVGRTLVVGGAERCPCQRLAEQERIQAEAWRRQLQRHADAFWQVSQFGEEFRAARLDKYRWPAGMARAQEAGRKVLRDGGGLLLYGPPGVGKSLLCCALLNEAAARGEFAVPATLPHLLDQMRASWDDDAAGPSEAWLTSKITSAPWVLLDDLGEVGRWGQDKVFALINARWMQRARLVTLATSNLPPADLAARLGDRVLSRLTDMCRPIECRGDDYRVSRARGRKADA